MEWLSGRESRKVFLAPTIKSSLAVIQKTKGEAGKADGCFVRRMYSSANMKFNKADATVRDLPTPVPSPMTKPQEKMSLNGSS